MRSTASASFVSFAARASRLCTLPPQQRLYFRPLPQGQRSFRLIVTNFGASSARATQLRVELHGESIITDPGPSTEEDARFREKFLVNFPGFDSAFDFGDGMGTDSADRPFRGPLWQQLAVSRWALTAIG